MTLKGPWLESVTSQSVCRALTAQGFQALFVGGCVRNALLNVPVSDIDIATDARPDQTIACANAAGLRAIPTGADHGTITVVAEGIAHEITTFRSDIETDGRHASVRFSRDVVEDAARRDFTMNALYAKPDGTLVDPLKGLDDLRAGHVRFIGDPQDRITEDYLRILRFFRFTAWYGAPSLGVDAEGLAACAEHAQGLAQVSKERIGAEMVKLMQAADPAPALAAMQASGVLSTVLPGADTRASAPLVHLENRWGLGPDAMRRFAALAGSEGADGFRLSKAQTARWAVLRAEVGDAKAPAHLGYLHGHEVAKDILLLRAALLEQPLNDTDATQADRGARAVFPIKSADLQPAFSGAALGAELRRLEARWIASDFTLGRADLLR